MAGMFDDLIPAPAAPPPAASGGMFDDLIPKAKAKPSIGGELASAITDIPHEIAHAAVGHFNELGRAVTEMLPSVFDRDNPNPQHSPTALGRAALHAVGVPFSLLEGPVRSLIGHGQTAEDIALRRGAVALHGEDKVRKAEAAAGAEVGGPTFEGTGRAIGEQAVGYLGPGVGRRGAVTPQGVVADSGAPVPSFRNRTDLTPQTFQPIEPDIAAFRQRMATQESQSAPGMTPASPSAPPPPGYANAQAADEFGIPLSRGQATGDLAAIRQEDMASRGAHGEPAQQVAAPFFENQFQAIGEGGRQVGQTLARGAGTVENPGMAAQTVNAEVETAAARARRLQAAAEAESARAATAQRGMVANRGQAITEAVQEGHPAIDAPRDAGELVAGGVRSAAAEARAAYKARYGDAFSRPGEFEAGAVNGVGERVRGGMVAGEDPVFLDDLLTPVASRAIRDLDNVENFRLAPKPTAAAARRTAADSESEIRSKVDKISERNSKVYDEAVKAQTEGRTADFERLKLEMDNNSDQIRKLMEAVPTESRRLKQTTGLFEEPSTGGAAAPAASSAPAPAQRPPAAPEQPSLLPAGPSTAADATGHLAPHTVSAPNGMSIDVTPRVVEARDVRVSSDPGYDARLQPRQRDRAAAQGQVRDIARNLNPERLGRSAEADRGAPIVGPDGMVESGNGRVMALRRVYEQEHTGHLQGSTAAQDYRDWLIRQGADISGFREPILVRGRDTPLPHEGRQAFATAANQPATLSMSATERAMADARLIDTNSLDLIRNPNDLGAVENRPFIRAFISRLPQAEQGALTTARGDLSSEGLARVRNAVLGRAYGDSPILARIAESTSDEIRSISGGLASAAPEWARLTGEIEAGRVPAHLDATQHLLDAVSRAAAIRERGGGIAAHLAQADAFGGPSSETESFLRMFYDPRTGRASSASRIADGIRHYAQEAGKVNAEPGLGLGLAPVTSADIASASARRAGLGSESTAFQATPQAGSQVTSADVAKVAAREIGAGPVPRAALAAPVPEPPFDLRGVEQARKRLVTYYKAARSSGNATDMRAMGRMLEEFDGQIETAISNGLFSGDPGALEALQQARASFARYQRTYRPAGAGDDVGQAMRRIIDRNATPEEVANMVTGSGRLGQAGLPVRIADRLETVLGRDSESFGAIRQAIWQRASQVRTTAGEIDAARSAASIENFTGSSLARRMFSPEELAAMRGHARGIQDLDRAIENHPATVRAQRVRDAYQELFGGEGIGGAQQAAFRRIVEGTATAEETANAVFGVISSGNPGNASRMISAIERLTGTGSDAMAAIRQGIWQRLTSAPVGKDQPGQQKIAQSIGEFLTGRGRSIAEQVYTADEIALMRRYAEAVKMTVIPKYARTNSDTAPSLMASMVQKYGDKIAHMLSAGAGALLEHAVGGATGGIAGSMVGASVSGLIRNRVVAASQQRAAARTAASLEPPSLPAPPAAPSPSGAGLAAELSGALNAPGAQRLLPPPQAAATAPEQAPAQRVEQGPGALPPAQAAPGNPAITGNAPAQPPPGPRADRNGLLGRFASAIGNAIVSPAAAGQEEVAGRGQGQAVPPQPQPIPQPTGDRIAPRSALDSSGMGAFTPPDTWAGQAQENVNLDIRNPQDRARLIDFAGGMVGPGSIKGRGAPPETLNFRSAGAVPGEAPATPLPARQTVDRPPTARELKEKAAYDAMLAEGRARAEARKAAQAGAAPQSGEGLNYASAGAGRGQAAADPVRAAPLAIKDAIEAPMPQDDMVRLYRGGGNNAGGPKWVTTDRRYAERYTTPGLAHSEGAGSYLQYVDVPKSDPRVQIPAGQNVHSFEAGPDISDRLKPLYSAGRGQAPGDPFLEAPQAASSLSAASPVEGHLSSLRDAQKNNAQFDAAIKALADDKGVRAAEMRQIATEFLGREPKASKGRSELLRDITDRQALDARQEARMRTMDRQYEAPAVPAADIPTKVRNAFDAAVRENGGFSQTEIANIQRRSGIPLADLHEYLLREAKAGRATLHPTTQAPADIPEAMAAAINLPGHPEPLVTMRLKTAAGAGLGAAALLGGGDESQAAEPPPIPGTRAAPVPLQSGADLGQAESIADQAHTPAQGEAGNARLGHVRWNGLEGAIEAPAGGVRRGVAPDGTPFETKVGAAYGYLKGIPPGADGQAPDAFWGPHPEKGGPVYIIDELDPRTGEFRQTKSMIGFQSRAAAVKAYTDTSSKDHAMIGGIKAMPADEFREHARSGGLAEPATPEAADLPGRRQSEIRGAVKEVNGEAHPDDVRLAGELMHQHGADIHDALERATLINALRSGDISAAQMASVIGEDKTNAIKQAASDLGPLRQHEPARAA